MLYIKSLLNLTCMKQSNCLPVVNKFLSNQNITNTVLEKSILVASSLVVLKFGFSCYFIVSV